MTRARIRLVYDKKTARYDLLVDMEQDTLDQRRHNARHERLVREFAGADAAVETVSGGQAETEAVAEPASGQPVNRRRES